MSTSTLVHRSGRAGSLRAWELCSTLGLATGVVLAALYGLLADAPYRGVTEATVLSARAQDVVSVAVAVVLVALLHPRGRTARGHVLRLGLLAYVAYSYAIYLTGLVMNRFFLGYVVVVCLSVAAFLDGLVRMRTSGWGAPSHRLARGTGWFLGATAVVFAALWLSVLVPFAVGGATPTPAGPGGVPYPVFVLDLTVALPCIFVVGWLLLHDRAIAVPLAAVALVKIVTLFTALWAGVLAGLVVEGHVALGPDAAPSAVLLVASLALLLRWTAVLPRATAAPLRTTLWRES